jgi:hypothetical protein
LEVFILFYGEGARRALNKCSKASLRLPVRRAKMLKEADQFRPITSFSSHANREHSVHASIKSGDFEMWEDKEKNHWRK